MDLLVIDTSLDNQEFDHGEDDTTTADMEQPSNIRQLRVQNWVGTIHEPGYVKRRSPRKTLKKAWNGEAIAEEMDSCLKGEKRRLSDAAEKGPEFRKYNTSWTTQYYILTHRAFKNSRSAIFTTLNLAKSIAIGVVAGLLWFQMDYTEQNINDIRSYCKYIPTRRLVHIHQLVSPHWIPYPADFFTMTFWVFDSMFSATMAFPLERMVILKERASGSYHLSAYFLAKTTSDAPVRLIHPCLYMIISFWMIGIDNRISVFVGTIGCTLMSVLAGEAIGLMVGASIYDLSKAITAMTVGTLFLMLLGGFFVENIPDFVAWGKFVSPFKYAFDSSLLLIFDRPVPCDGSGVLQDLCNDGSTVGEANSYDVRDFIGIQGTVGFNVGMLLLLCFLPRYVAYAALRSKKASER
jgi:hypothetical protein